MVFYELVLTQVKPGFLGFSNNGNTYSTPNNNAFQFVFVNDPTLRKFGYDTTAGGPDIGWRKNMNPHNIVLFPEDLVNFEIGDCIHVVNSTSDVATLVIQVAIGQRITRLLPGNSEVWLVWRDAATQFSDKPCCVTGDTEVLTPKGLKLIKDLKRGDRVINHKGKTLKVINNIKSVRSKEFINISESSFAFNVPSKDLLIRPGHPILIDGKQKMPESLLSHVSDVSKVQLDNYEDVYSLCTKEPDFVMMNNLPVASWGFKRWKSHVLRNPSLIFTTF